ncbi:MULTISPECIES: 3-phosphoshikimate 1-carboxyvinyltransferase [Anaerostipes]|uniref:3-phosphoshikimate 1-carboxyvinyltransferase n=1 Tax=Anaerostipes TaxID=207244 RepID=UPI000952EFD3|nr:MULTISPECIES: 3-phosphoshikimate 1-carboxyvinyltransferase [Anaerostipes]MCI5622667.1 3-phosphoshikimate 1-carboxyvinyltransferase [Anaerostipes sp.]MDY2726726.1 3-phosphoshikimate 1-carboxyvinyltransferase [Anaerostipes faecalis]OLR60182.1 3-phosphoshikimate 1-carboxyvinyltransferase [Anaerostipes sp. 494a]
MKLTRVNGLQGELSIPGDKSISHRAVMFGSLAKGTTHISNFLSGADCLATIDCFRKMGVEIEQNGTDVTVYGNGLHGLKQPEEILDVGNSGTTTRLISGILAGQDFQVTLSGDASLNKRPMKRIMNPLKMMGADIESVNGNGCAPLHICGGKLKGIHYESPVASAQVKSCALLAGLYADGKTSVTEPVLSRNHTELMLRSFGVQVDSEGTTATITPPDEMYATDITVPGDISSATFFIVAGLITPNSHICLKNVGINPTRDGILRVCRDMGADITLENIVDNGGEPTADIIVKTSHLKGTVIGGEVIPTLIDEIPVIALLAAFADGETVIKDAAELKVKESDRIALTVDNLVKMGVDATATDDGMIIRGGNKLHGASIHCKYDHRIAMTFSIAGINADGETIIEDAECVDVSYPTFYDQLNSLQIK